MPRKTKAEKQMGRDVQAAFTKHGTGRQFDMFDLGKIDKAGLDAGKAGDSIDEAVKAACDQYEVKK